MRNRGPRAASGVRLTVSVSRPGVGSSGAAAGRSRLRGAFAAAGQQGDELVRLQGPGRWIGLVYEEPTATGAGIRSLSVDGKPVTAMPTPASACSSARRPSTSARCSAVAIAACGGVTCCWSRSISARRWCSNPPTPNWARPRPVLRPVEGQALRNLHDSLRDQAADEKHCAGVGGVRRSAGTRDPAEHFAGGSYNCPAGRTLRPVPVRESPRSSRAFSASCSRRRTTSGCSAATLRRSPRSASRSNSARPISSARSGRAAAGAGRAGERAVGMGEVQLPAAAADRLQLAVPVVVIGLVRRFRARLGPTCSGQMSRPSMMRSVGSSTPEQPGEGRQDVDRRGQLVQRAGRDAARPAHDARHAHAAFERRALCPRAAGRPSRRGRRRRATARCRR